MLADVAKELRELQDESLVKVNHLRQEASDQLEIYRKIGARIILAEERLDGAMAVEEWLKANVANLPLDHAAKCKKFAKGGYSDPRQMLLDGIAPKQIEDKTHDERTPASEWEQAWRNITKLAKCEWQQWPQEQVDLTRDNLAATVAKFGGKVVWE